MGLDISPLRAPTNEIVLCCLLCLTCPETVPLRTVIWIVEVKSQVLVGAISFCGEYPGPRFEDKFRSAKQMDEISTADAEKMADS